MSHRRSTMLFGGGLLLSALLASLSSGETSPEPSSPPSRRVRVAAVGQVEEALGYRFPGLVRGRDRAELAFGVAGRLATRPVDVGDRVEAGASLATLDPEELGHAATAARARRAELLARLEQARRDEERVEALLAQQAATPEEAERVRAGRAVLAAGLEVAEAEVAEADRRLRETRLTAPFAGTVTAVRAEVGERVGAAAAIVELEGRGGAEVRLELPEGVASLLAAGDDARVDLPLLGRRGIPARVRTVAGASGGAGHLFAVVVDLDEDPEVRPGVTAEVGFSPRPRQIRTVPLAAVLDPAGGNPYVLRVTAGHVEAVAVTVARLLGDRVEVQGELRAGDQVVVAGHLGLVSGEAVEVVR